MKNTKTTCIAIAALTLTFLSCNTEKTPKKYTAEVVENDPMNVHSYTLDNGLKVNISVNKDEPRIQTLIAVKAGSKNDPKDCTGLAHYLEHMLFNYRNYQLGGRKKVTATNF